jgi:putative selenium metabolism protein SsnA
MSVSNGLVIEGATVVTGGAEASVIHDGAVAVEGSRVAYVGPAADLRGPTEGATVLDATGKLVMPGLINAHTHLYSALARGLMVDIEPSGCFEEILKHLWWRLDRALTMDDIRASALVGAIDLIRNATTTIIDHHASQVNIDGALSLVAETLEGAGLRSNLCFEVTDRDGPDVRDAGLRENERFADSLPAASGEPPMLTASFGLHASFTLDDVTLDAAAGAARERGIGCHIHVAEDVADVEDSLRRGGTRVVERLASHGVLGERTIGAHCNHIDDREREILRDTDTVVVHNPQSNMNNAVGCADVEGLLGAGILVGLGTDGFTASMFDEMKVLNLVHRDRAGDPGAGHGLPGRLCLTNNGHVGERLFGERLGVLRKGAPADIIILDYDPPTPIESGNFEGHVIFGLTGWMVETVVVNGRVVMRDREVLSVDVPSAMAEARERATALWGNM